jgi:hypothetical protein
MTRYRAALVPLVLLSGCVEITTYVSPSASGTIIDAQSQKPIEGATISVKGHRAYSLKLTPGGPFLLTPAARKTHIFALGAHESLPPSGTLVVSADGYILREIAVKDGVNSPVVSLQRVR